uniref:C-type lectin domain-containing protein n=1 Tax=Panagrolaimus davidi TaxID=227884 RepID=A0A914QYK5_9BILA
MLKLLIFAVFVLTITAECPNGTLEWQGSCFFFETNATGFAAAEENCVKIGGHLVSIHDAFTDALLARGNWSWMDGTLMDFTDWASEEPKNVTGNNCATLSQIDGFWRSDNCFKSKPFICKIEKTEPSTTTLKTTTTATKYPIYANCTFPFIYFEPTHSCYGVGNFTGTMSWTTGEAYCEEFGAHLTSIHSYDERRFLGSMVYTAHEGFWTGAFSNDGGKSWAWSDRTPWDYNPWISGYPALHTSACGTLWGGGITDNWCNNTGFQIICKKGL